jgi:hypothetical protein
VKGGNLTSSSLSTIKALSISNLDTKKIDSILNEIETCLKRIDSAILSKSIDYDIVSINNKNQAYISFGRVISEFTDKLRIHILNSLKEVMAMDHQYLCGNKIDQIETDVSQVNSSDDLSSLIKQLNELERWLGD